MSRARKTTPEWRAFEQLVARIEQSLAPKGAIVTSPDRVVDLVTGRKREVDATIRLSVGPTPVLIAIECRKRGNVQDDTWIEQLATKRAKIGAAITIAVSATGFSDSAKKTARLHNIELRTLEDRIGEEISRRFLSGLQIGTIVTDYRIKSLLIVLDDGTALPFEQFGASLRAAVEANSAHLPVGTDAHSGGAITLDGIASRVGDADLPEDGTVVAKEVVASYKPQRVKVETTAGPRYVSQVRLGIDFSKRYVRAAPTNLFEYAGTEGTIRRVVVAETAVDAEPAIRIEVDIDSPVLDRIREGRDRP